MKVRRNALFILILFFIPMALFAESYSIRVANAETMTVDSNVVTLSGEVVLDFTSDDTKRSLSADTVVVFLDDKILEATGSVELKEGDDNTFKGDSLVLNWDTLDIVVYYGKGASDRKSTDGDSVHFYSSGQKINYEGSENIVFFTDGVIATKSENPYWSVSAKRIALLESDIIFENATIKIGRVPLLWVPFFFYTGTRLAFNPAIGLSSSKGMFINTTTELYGTFPVSETKTSSSSDDEDDVIPASVFSFLRSSQSGEIVRDGIIYTELKDEGSLSKLESWARKSKSYFAITADAYEKTGVAFGFITDNNLFDKALNINAKAVLAYKSEFRYAVDFASKYSKDKTQIKISIPYSSDPDVRPDFYNRNTVFGMDSIFGTEQSFPSSVSSSTTNKWSLEASTSLALGNYSFSVDSLSAGVDWKWDSSLKKYMLDAAKLPYVKVSSKGTVFDLKGSDSSEVEVLDYEDETARLFAQELLAFEKTEGESFDIAPAGFVLMDSPSLNNSRTIVHKSGFLKLSYTYNQTLENTYKTEMVNDSMATKANMSVDLSGGLPNELFSFSEKIVPDYSYLRDSDGKITSSAKLVSNFTATQKFLGLTYTLNTNLYSVSEKDGEKTVKPFEWTKDYVKAHSIKISKSLGHVTLSVEDVLKPLTSSIIPSVSYSYNGISATASLPLYPEKDNILDESTAKLDFSIKKSVWNFSLNNQFKFPEDGWETYTLKQNFGLKFGKFTFTEDANLKKKFVFNSLVFSVGYGENIASLSFKDENVTPDRLKVKIKQTVLPFYTWKNRIGFEGVFESDFTYDFSNKYATSLVIGFRFNFAISQFLDLSVNVSTVNNGFYKYYDELTDSFVFRRLWEDFVRSLDIFGDGIRQTQFTLNSVKISLVHYMSAWNLYADFKAELKTISGGKKAWSPELTVYVQWNEIPELKIKNKLNGRTGEWEK